MHLSDCFIELFAYVTYFLKTVEVKQPSYEQVQGDVRRLMAESEKNVEAGLCSRDDYDLSRFAVCAWVDEAILRSPWERKHLWLKEQLQRFYYNTTDAGEEFFERLGSIGLHQREVREVYYLCLSLGFTGRYCHAGDEYQLEQVKTANLKLLLGSSVGLPSLERSDLFPEAYPAGSMEGGGKGRRFSFNLVTILCLAGPVFLFGVLYLVYRFTLSGVGDNFLRTVAN